MNKHKPTKEELLKSYKEKNRAKDGTPLYFMKENVTKMFGDFETSKIDVFEQLQESLTKEQVIFFY